MSNLIAAWLDAKRKLEEAKEEEDRLREQIIETYSSGDVEEGTESVELFDGSALKIVRGLTYKLPPTAETNAVLHRIAAMGNHYPFIAERLVKWEPKLLLSEYRKLNADDPAKKLIDSILITTPSKPQVKYVEAK